MERAPAPQAQHCSASVSERGRRRGRPGMGAQRIAAAAAKKKKKKQQQQQHRDPGAARCRTTGMEWRPAGSMEMPCRWHRLR